MKKYYKSNVSNITEMLYLFMLAIYILKLTFNGTLFYIPWPANFEKLLRLLTCAVIFLKLGYDKAYKGKEMLACILTGCMFGLSWVSTGYNFLLDIALLSIGAVGIPCKNILKISFGVKIYVLFLTILGSSAGCIPDRIYSDGIHFRHAFGIVYPTDFAAHITFLAITGWVLYEGAGVIMPIMCALGLAVFIYYFCNAKCSTSVIGLLTFGILYYFLTEKFYKKYSAVFWLKKLADNILIYIMPICALLIVCLTFFFNTENTILNHINILLSNRLSLGQDAINTYGIKFFGTPFEQIGFGGGMAKPSNYNFVDSSYILLLVRYGLVILLAVCIQWIWFGRNALKNGQRKLVLSLSLIAIHGTIEQHLLEIEYNIFILLSFTNFTCTAINEKKNLKFNKNNFFHMVKNLAIIAAAIISLPKIMTYIKTLVDLLQFSLSERHILFIGGTTIVLCAGGLFTWLIFKTAAIFVLRKHKQKKIFAGLIIAAVTAAASAVKSAQLIEQAQEKYQSLIETDRPIIEAFIASKASIGKLYVDHVPELYQREFGIISNSMLSAKGTFAQKDSTLIVNDEEELQAYIENGYEYGEIMPGRAIYTNSETVKKLLYEMGIILTNYYSKQKTVDLDAMAVQNKLEMTENETLILNGIEKSLWHGSGINIYKGWLQVEYKIRLISSTANQDIAATAQLSSDWGQRLWTHKDIYLSEFDENGDCTYSFTTHIWENCDGVEILLFVPDGVEIELKEIKYGKVG